MKHICPPYCHQCPEFGIATSECWATSDLGPNTDEWREYCACERPNDWRAARRAAAAAAVAYSRYIERKRGEGKDVARLERIRDDYFDVEPLSQPALDYIEACRDAGRPLKGL